MELLTDPIGVIVVNYTLNHVICQLYIKNAGNNFLK